MKKNFICLIVFLLAASVFAQIDSSVITFRVVSSVPYETGMSKERWPADCEPFTFFSDFFTGNKTVFAERNGLAISGCDVDSIDFSVEEITGLPCVYINFSADAADRFATFTQNNVGNSIAMDVNGFVIFTAQLCTPIVGGRLQIGNLSRNTVYHVAEAFDCKDKIEYPANLQKIGPETKITSYDETDLKDFNQVCMNFFYSLLNDTDDFEKYVAPDSLKYVKKYREVLLRDYKNCTVRVESEGDVYSRMLNHVYYHIPTVNVYFELQNDSIFYVGEVVVNPNTSEILTLR
ncbi:SecDF P1 head subdomain-containing protein [Treponema zioleckii]|uniref:SecDF P1 head subdomain-containing protein n=1 Tax=Treponema zioleckii TaxID=331680 RepID=UPI00168AEE9B|nr:hypothetical protein [Treponema zioleckii]